MVEVFEISSASSDIEILPSQSKRAQKHVLSSESDEGRSIQIGCECRTTLISLEFRETVFI